jgi:hypothetical protein
MILDRGRSFTTEVSLPRKKATGRGPALTEPVADAACRQFDSGSRLGCGRRRGQARRKEPRRLLFDGCASRKTVMGPGARHELERTTPSLGHWHQIRPDYALPELDGGDGGKWFAGRGPPSVTSTRVVHRLSDADGGQVLQHWEFSKNEGRTDDGVRWTYVRKKSRFKVQKV